MKVYTIYDSKVGAYMQPFFARAGGEACRMFEQLVNDGQSMVSKFPADFTLFESADFDDATGTFTQHSSLVNLGCAVEFVRNSEPRPGLVREQSAGAPAVSAVK